MLALGEMCFEGMGAVAKGVSRVGTGWKCVFRAWGQLKRGFEELAPGEMCFRGMGQLKSGFHVLALGEICFQGMGAGEKGV